MLIRCVIRGIVAGGLANLLVLLALSHFFERFVELMLLPVTGAAIGVLIGAIALIRRSRPETRRAPPGNRRLFIDS